MPHTDDSTVEDVSTVERVVRSLIESNFPWAATQGIATSTDLRNDVGLDSLHLVELQALIEAEIGVDFDPLDNGFLEAFDTFGTLVGYVSTLVEQ